MKKKITILFTLILTLFMSIFIMNGADVHAAGESNIRIADESTSEGKYVGIYVSGVVETAGLEIVFLEKE